MHVPINVKSPTDISEWQMEFNSAFKGLSKCTCKYEAGWIYKNISLEPAVSTFMVSMKYCCISNTLHGNTSQIIRLQSL